MPALCFKADACKFQSLSQKQGEELFWNYRHLTTVVDHLSLTALMGVSSCQGLHPRIDGEGCARYPSWYSPVDEDALQTCVLTKKAAGE